MSNPTKRPVLQAPTLTSDRPGMLLRRRVEKRLVWNLLDRLQAAGYYPRSVDNSEERLPVADATAAMEEIFSVDEAMVYFSYGKGPVPATLWVFLVGGNGEDIVSDYSAPQGSPFTAALDAFLDEIESLI